MNDVKAGTYLKRLFYPPHCLLCGQILDVRAAAAVCTHCRPADYIPTNPRCPVCSRPVDLAGKKCPGCRAHHNVTVGRGTLLYRDAVQESIHAFKYEGMKEYASGYAKLMIEFDRDFWSGLGEDFALVPVPIHAKRRRERGYNQAEELARALAEAFLQKTGMRIPVWPGLLRTKHTAPLRQMGAQSRRRALAGAFQIDSRAGSPPVQTLVLIDDIYTSGSTIETCAEVLKKHFPNMKVFFWTAAIRE